MTDSRRAAKRLAQNHCPNGTASQSPGLAALFAAYPGDNSEDEINPEGVEYRYNPFRVESGMTSIPGVGRKKRGQPRALLRCPFRAAFRYNFASIILGDEEH